MKRNSIILKIFVTLIVSITLGAVLLLGIYALPTDRIRNNLENSASLYKQDENKIDNWMGYLRYAKIDNYTDSIMANMALCREYDSIVENALLNPRYAIDKNLNEYSSSDISLFLEEDNIVGTIDYARYWHGYLIFLVPSLFFTNLGGVRMILTIVEFLLAMLLLYKVSKINPIYMFAYAVTILFINPITTALNMQNADIYILMLVFSNIIVFFNDWLKENNRYYILFALIGICTSYFDFLTYPLVSWGIPMITMLLVNEDNIKVAMKNIVLCGIFWIFGYLGMWVGKWIIASLFTETNVIKEAFYSVTIRSSNLDNSGNKTSFITAMSLLNESINDVPMALLAIVSIAVVVIYSIVNKYSFRINKQYLLGIIPYIIIGLTPFCWAFVVRNHFATHQFLEYRTMAVFVLTILIIFIKLFSKKGS